MTRVPAAPVTCPQAANAVRVPAVPVTRPLTAVTRSLTAVKRPATAVKHSRRTPVRPARAARRAAAALLFTAVLGAGCGGGQTQGAAFEPTLRDDGKTMAALRERLASVPIPLGAPVAVGVFGDHTLVGVDLTGGEPWTFEHPIDCRPVVAGEVVVGVGDNEMFGLDARTGKPLWTRKAGGCLRGAADDGHVTVVSSRPITGLGGIVVAIGRDGLVVRQVEDDSNIGVPGLVDGVVFLPWEGRYVSAYDLSVGEEVARVLFTDRVTRAFASGGALFFGERTATRFDGRIALAPKGRASTVALPERALPGDPRWMESGNDALPPRAVPSDRVQLIARPAASGPPRFVGERYAATHGRAAMGLDAKDGALAWVHAHDASFLGGAAYDGGFALCDAEGVVTFLDARTGAVRGERSLGKPVDVCLVQADAFSNNAAAAAAPGAAAPGNAAAAAVAPPAGAPAEPERPLRDQIADVLQLRYLDAAPIQRFLLRELAASPDERATETLIDVVAGAVVPEDLAADARAALADRRTGASYMLAALAQRPDFLEGTTGTPALAPLADALAAIGDRRAAPLLAGHLLDPATPAPDVAHVARALATLAGPEELPSLRHFFAMYRSERSDEDIAAAVAAVARALERLGAGDAVAAALADPYTSDLVRGRLR